MKIKNIFLLIFTMIGSGLMQAQHENDNWRFGNNNWKFDNAATPNGFTHTTGLNPYIRYASSVISDKNTGNLLFYSNGYSIYNKNNVVMQDGDHLFGLSNTNGTYQIRGNPSDQSSIIVPIPGSPTKYYVFFINGNRKSTDHPDFLTDKSNIPTNYGFGYAVVDLSFNGGLGKVISKGMLFTNSPTNALTSTIASDGNSYWVVTANNGNFLSYKVDANGLNTTPIVSPAPSLGNFIKISPDTKKLLTRATTNWPNNGVFLYDFNNETGSIVNALNIAPDPTYIDYADYVNNAEFSSDSNIVYFAISTACFCNTANTDGGIAMYNISTGQLVGYTNNGPNSGIDYPFVLKGASVSLQRAQNGKIYLIQAIKLRYNDLDKTEVVQLENLTTYYSYNWAVINTPNVWNTNVNPVSLITPPTATKNGFSFPQLIPTFDAANSCQDVLTITTPVTSSKNYQSGQTILASSSIGDNLKVKYKAGTNVKLLPGFYYKPVSDGVFNAYTGPCTSPFLKGGMAGMTSKIQPEFAKTTPNIGSSEVKIYPNPASTIVKIDSGKNQVAGWILYDLSGKIVLDGKTTTVSVEKLPKSSYLLVIKLDNGTSTSKKIIVQ